MKVGIISDIHGNHFALENVLKEGKILGVEKYLVLGDLVGYYYHPEKVLELLSEVDTVFIKGNHEVILENLYHNQISEEFIYEKYGRGHHQAINKLDNYTLQWLFNLPTQKSVIIDELSFQLNHGSPWDINQYLYPDTPSEILEQCNSEKHDFVLVGHSHYAFTFKCKNSILINCGSVGQSRQKGGVAYWAIVDTIFKNFELKTTPYDISRLLREIEITEPKIGYASKILHR